MDESRSAPGGLVHDERDPARVRDLGDTSPLLTAAITNQQHSYDRLRKPTSCSLAEEVIADQAQPQPAALRIDRIQIRPSGPVLNSRITSTVAWDDLSHRTIHRNRL
jgi:hypothetical protein